ncbi:MAG: hypothetical protein JRI75_05545, partial [Deltaproteobacteria bacterium]|nr:hypothetical protein [Deltaproteobacteria bacterium]
MKYLDLIKNISKRLLHCLRADVYFGRHPARVPYHAIVVLPFQENLFCCGLAGIVSYKNKKKTKGGVDIASLNRAVQKVCEFTLEHCLKNNLPLDDNYLGGKRIIGTLMQSVRALKCNEPFY